MAILVNGLGLIQTASAGTDQAVVNAYNAQWQIIQSVYNKNPSSVTAADAASVSNAMNALKGLASQGLTINVTDIHGNPVATRFLVTADMARQIDLLSRSMDAANFSGNDVIGLQRWMDLRLQGVNLVVNRAGQAVDNNRSIQAMIELEYVKTGNDVLSQQLSSLQTALSTTQAVAQTLTRLQNVRNSLTPEQRSAFSLSSLSGSFDNTVKQYNSLASSLFGRPIDVIVNYNGQNPQDVLNQVAQIRQSLSLQLQQLDQLNPPKLSSTGLAIRDPNSLAGSIATVLSDMAKFFDPTNSGTLVITQSAMESWLIDNLNTHLNNNNASAANAAGIIQKNLEAAIQAATNLNDTQKEQFQRYMFVFQEFYKSAASMLTTINQIIQTMAQHSGGS